MGSALTSIATGGMFGDSQPDYGHMIRQLEKERQARINTGMKHIDKAFAGFTPTFYDDYGAKIQNEFMPQVAEQAREASKAQAFGVAERGLMGGSVDQAEKSSLARKTEGAKRQVADEALAAKQELKMKILDQRNRLIGMLYESAMPGQAQRIAIETASQFQAPSVQKPIQSFLPGVMGGMGAMK